MNEQTVSPSAHTAASGPRHVLGLIGWSGSGKTTLVTRLIPALTARGLTVSTMKHTHHNFDMDHPGKDSYRHREAGAEQVLLTSGKRWALLHELRGQAEPAMEDLIAKMEPVDLLLIEGFKSHDYPKIEVNRPSLGKKRICETDDSVIALASDEAAPELDIPVLELGDAEAIAAFIVDHFKIDV